MYIKSLEIDRHFALKKNQGQFDAFMQLSQKSTDCLEWWINTEGSFRPISYGRPCKKIESVHYKNMLVLIYRRVITSVDIGKILIKSIT